ncbi:hypothetical protein MY10362_005521 [Beauveria mimosiformis]
MRLVEPFDVASPSAAKEQMSSTTERKASPTTGSSLDSAVSHYAYEHFDRRRQLRRLLTKSLARWLITVVLCAAIYGVLLGYSSHDALPQRKKLEFNTLVIALTISLGLNIASSLKANAVELQWWLLSLRRYKAREADLIMSSEHFTTMLQLGWTTRHTLIQIFVVVFVTMNIGSQIALALLGITYNINPANHFAITKPGLVSIADLNDIQGSRVLAASKKRHETEDVNSRRYSANLYGQFGSTFDEGGLDQAPKPGALYNAEQPQVFYSKELPLDSDGSDGSAATKPGDNGNAYSYTYFFWENTVANASYTATVASNRSVTVAASCDSYKVVAVGNGSSSNITVRFKNGEDVYYLPVANGGSQILYLHDPATDANDTRSQVNAFEPSDTDPWFYTCQVSVGNVTNGFLPQHYMGTNFTRYIPPAIALQGYGASASDIGLSNTTTNYQFQSYPLQTFFGQPASGSGVYMAALVSRYAINALAVGALFSSNVDVPGMEPQRAIQLEITKWRYVHVIVGLTVGVQLIIHLVAVLVANRVQVREQRSLATASLLRPLLAGVSERASMARGKQIAKLIGKDVTVRYEPVGAGYDLCIYRNGQLEQSTPNTINR